MISEQELGKIWKEIIWPNSKVYISICLKEMKRKKRQNIVSVAGLSPEV
jgi:ferric iron reductase protein FhuF